MVDTSLASSDITIFDRGLVKQRRERAAQNFQKHNFLFDWSRKQIHDRLMDINRSFDRSLQLGSRCILSQHPKIRSTIISDITVSSIEETSSPYIQASEEFLPFAQGSLDLVLSNLNLHTINDLPGALIQIRRALKADGLFIASLFGGETLYELRQIMTEIDIQMHNGASPHIFPFADKPQMGDLLHRAGYALPVIDSEFITVTYDNIFKLFADLRGMGESNSIIERRKTPLSRHYFMECAKAYQKRHQESDGRIVATFEIIFILGWAPHKSQQKPLKPGSAEFRLADALDTKERIT